MDSLSLKRNYDQLISSTMGVEEGYGEYLIYSIDKTVLPEAVFAEVLGETSIQSRVSSGESFLELSSRLEALHPNVGIIFIPRTLYELGYIVASLEEEKISSCEEQGWTYYDYRPSSVSQPPLGYLSRLSNFIRPYLGLGTGKDRHQSKNADTCWHLIDVVDRQFASSEKPSFVHLAYRLNNRLVKDLGHFDRPLKGLDIADLTERYLVVLQDHKTTFLSAVEEKKYICSPDASLFVNFGLSSGEKINYASQPMGVGAREAQVIRNAIALECDPVAQKAFILYRAAKIETEITRTDIDGVKHISFSYGESLFAGCVRDPTATVFFYVVHQKRDPYATIVPWVDLKDSPFYIPLEHTLVQLLSRGEWFHPRSKVSRAIEEKNIKAGETKVTVRNRHWIDSEKSSEQLGADLQQYWTSSTYFLTAQRLDGGL